MQKHYITGIDQGGRLPIGDLSYGAAQLALWDAVRDRDTGRIEQALGRLAAEDGHPFMLAVAAAAMQASGRADRAEQLVRQGMAASGTARHGGGQAAAAQEVLACLAAGRDPFAPFPGLAAMADGREVSLSALVGNILGHADPAALVAGLEALFAGLRRSGMAAGSAGYAAASVTINLLLAPRYLLVGGDGAPDAFQHPLWVQAGLPADRPLPLRDGSIELAVLCDGAAEGGIAVAQALGEIGRLLKPGGAAILMLRQDRHEPADIRGILEAGGFQVVSAEAGPILQRHADLPPIGREIATCRMVEAIRQPGPGAGGRASGEADLVSPRAIGQAGSRIPAANAAAWEPRDLPNLEPREVRLGLLQLHGLLWEYHADMVWALRSGCRPTQFLAYGYATGQIAETWRPGIEAIFGNRPFRFERADCRADGIASIIKDEELAGLQQNQAYFAPDAAQRAALLGFLEESREQIERELQTPWTVLNVRCYRTHGAFTGGPQKWHADNLPKSIYKLLLYLTDTPGPVLGSELIDLMGQRQAVSGASGTWLLFDPTSVTHRAPESGTAIRPIVEVLLCSSLKTDIRFRFGGTNYRNPFCPPGIDLFDDPKAVNARSLAMTLYNTARVFTLARQGPGVQPGAKDQA